MITLIICLLVSILIPGMGLYVYYLANMVAWYWRHFVLFLKRLWRNLRGSYATGVPNSVLLLFKLFVWTIKFLLHLVTQVFTQHLLNVLIERYRMMYTST